MQPDLKEGQKIKVTQRVRVGADVWTHEVVGTFLGADRRRTGIHTDRVPQDDIRVSTILMEKDNGERTAVALDEHTQVDVL